MAGEDAEQVTLDIEALRKQLEGGIGSTVDLTGYYMPDYYRYLEAQAQSYGGDWVDQWAKEMEMTAIDTANVATLTNADLQEEIDRLKLAALNASAYENDQLEDRIDEIEKTVTTRTETITKTIVEYANSPEVTLTVKLESLSAELQAMSDLQASATEMGFAGLTEAFVGMWEVDWEGAIAEMQKVAEKMEMDRIKKLAETVKAKTEIPKVE